MTSLVNVYFVRGNEKCFMGRLSLKDRKILFEYDLEFVETGLELSPFKLPLQLGVITSRDYTFGGLFGVFNDSLPDGWGRMLLDRKLMKSGINPESHSPLDRLCFVGDSGMGAIVYSPGNHNKSSFDHDDSSFNDNYLDEIAEEIKEFQENDNDRFVEDLLSLGGSSGGARPKILVRYEDDYWIIKFRSYVDPKDIGNIEYAYHLMAKDANLDVPEARLFLSRKGLGYFGVKRFDRLNGKRIHMHTISGLLHADHRVPSLDYEAIMKATMCLTQDLRQCEKQFRAAVFNVLSHNRDDHAKNFSFLMDEKGIWSVSPAYDLTFSAGLFGEHCTMVMGEGKNPGLKHLLGLASIGDIKESKAMEIIEEVVSAVSKWTLFAEEAGVRGPSRRIIKQSIDQNLISLY